MIEFLLFMMKKEWVINILIPNTNEYSSVPPILGGGFYCFYIITLILENKVILFILIKYDTCPLILHFSNRNLRV